MPFGFRPDGDRVKGLPPVHAIMPFLFPTRTESVVYYEMLVDGRNIKPFLDEARATTGVKVNLLHLVISAAARILGVERPRMNRFVIGGRVYQRRGVWISYSAKTEKTDEGAVVALKRRYEPCWDLKKVVEVTDGAVGEPRSGKADASEKEIRLALLFPAFMVSFFVWVLRTLDKYGLMPRSMIDSDPLYSSFFIANMGSINMDAPFHHLYEWGNIPLFCAIGKQRDDGMIPFRFTFDERVEDGLYCLKALDLLKTWLENPADNFNLGAPSRRESLRSASPSSTTETPAPPPRSTIPS